MSSRRKTAVIIGSGVGGTTIAARLAKNGFDVTVYEKNSHSGGRLSLLHKNGHRFDQGPSLYLMPKIFEETYRDLGESIENHLDLLRCPKNYSIHFHDGDKFELSCDFTEMYEQIRRYEGDSEDVLCRFLDFLKESHIHYEQSVSIALKMNYTNWWNEFQLKHIPAFFKLHLWDTVYNRIKKFFKSDKMRHAFSFQSMYIGMSPYDSPAPYNLLQYTEIAEGIWYPRGGFHKVIETIEGIATKKFDAKFVYNSGVEKIIVDTDNVAKGVRLENGNEVFADVVICNADLVYAYNELLPSTPYGEKLGQKAALTSSTISFYWCMSKKIPQLDSHNVFLSENYKSSFDDIFDKNLLPEEPSFYIHVPSRIDSDAAPEGKDSVVVLVPVGHLTPENENKMDEMIKIARSKVLKTLEKRLNTENFGQFIEAEIVNDPRTWQKKFNLWKGSALGLSHNILQVLYFRPSTRSHLFKNLYMVGASAHPGTGVPIIMYGAKLVEEQILGDLGLIKKENDHFKIFMEYFLVALIITFLILIVRNLLF